MATKNTSKADQDRKQREAAAAEREAAGTETGPALAGGTVVRQGSGGAPVGTKAKPKTDGPKVDVVAVDEIPKADRTNKQASVWVDRLKAAEQTPKGRARIHQANTPATAGGTAYRLRKALKEGKHDAELGAGAAKRYTIITVGSDIYAEVKKSA